MLKRRKLLRYIYRIFRRKPVLTSSFSMPELDLREIPFPIAAQLPLEVVLQAFSTTPSNNGGSLYKELKDSLPDDRIFPGKNSTGILVSIEYRERILEKYCITA